MDDAEDSAVGGPERQAAGSDRPACAVLLHSAASRVLQT